MARLIITFAFLHILTFATGKAPENKTIASYDPSELLAQIFNHNDSIPRARFGSVQFEGDNVDENDHFYKRTVKFKDESNIHYSEVSSDQNEQNSRVNFQGYDKDDSKKRRRRRRKPKQQYGLQNLPNRPDLAQYNGIPNSGFVGQYYRPPRPRPSIASDALSAVTDALTSIALYDDQQCVPRLLCEAAGGGALGSSGIVQTLSGIQPLLTLLSAYNGISSNPLFVFGRAVFLGMSSNGNTASCRYAYPLCPTDPEQLVYYLNNHNGGFFRFFNSPQQGQQNVEQFYNQLTQNYGLYQQGQPQNYGFYNPNPAQNYGFDKPNLYQGHSQQNYGLAFPYGNNNIRFKNSHNLEITKNIDKVQRRIQNNPISQHFVHTGDFNSKWIFPETVENSNMYYVNNDLYKSNDFYEANGNSAREVKVLRFPDSNQESVTEIQGYDRKIRGFTFPESNSNTRYNDYNYVKSNDAYNDKFTYNNKYYENKYVYNGNNNADDLSGVRTVYVVRGNGDPSDPEIIKLRPGETIQ